MIPEQRVFLTDAIDSVTAHMDEHAECSCQPNRLDIDLVVRAAQEALRASDPSRDTSEAPNAPESPACERPGGNHVLDGDDCCRRCTTCHRTSAEINYRGADVISASNTYTEIRTQAWEERGEDFATMHRPDPLWTCSACGAAVADREKHDRWHSLSRVGFGRRPA